MKKSFTLAVAILCCAFVAYGQTTTIMPRFEIPTTQANGMGGSHIAYTDNVFSLLVNPAAMIHVQQKSIFTGSAAIYNPEMTFGLLSSFMDIAGAGAEAGNGEGNGTFGAFGDALNGLKNGLPESGKIGLGLDIRGPLSQAWVANGFGFGIWDRIHVNPNIIGTDDIEVNAFVDVIVPVGIAFQIFDIAGQTLDLGVTLKPYGRVMIDQGKEPLSPFDLMSKDFAFDKAVSAPLIIGMGLDMGLMYRGGGLLKGLTAGMTITDIFNRGKAYFDFFKDPEDELPDTVYTVPAAFNLGAAYELKLGNLLGLVVAADWRDVFSNPNDYTKRNPVLNFGLGAELSLLNIFKFRVGLSDSLPSIGAGVNMGTFEFSLAYYGKELGLEPGANPVAVMDLTIAFHPEAQKRVWPWARNPFIKL